MKKQNGGSSVGFLGLLTILFIGLKLTSFIDWSWLFVFSPKILSITIIFVSVIIYVSSQGK